MRRYPVVPGDQNGDPITPEIEKPVHKVAHDFDDTIQHDEELQQDIAEANDEREAMQTLAESRDKA